MAHKVGIYTCGRCYARRHATKAKLAFTLAEVLITLGIIGVVAALTIPSLMTKYHRMTVETKLKKFYSTMNQAIKLSEEDNDGFLLSILQQSKIMIMIMLNS